MLSPAEKYEKLTELIEIMTIVQKFGLLCILPKSSIKRLKKDNHPVIDEVKRFVYEHDFKLEL